MTPTAELASFIEATIQRLVAQAETRTEYRAPLVGFAAADDPRFARLRHVAEPSHLLPADLLPGARSVVSFFLPFAPSVVEANARQREEVAREWAVAYIETNALIARITAHLIEALAQRGIRAAAEPATHNFDPVSLISRWSHKSVAVIAGLAGCAQGTLPLLSRRQLSGVRATLPGRCSGRRPAAGQAALLSALA